MLDKTTKRLRLFVLISALAGGVLAAAGNLFVSSAQWEGYECPAQYHTCYMDPTDPWGIGGGEDGGGGGGGTISPCDKAGGKWECPVKEISSEGSTSGKCTSAGCQKYSNDGLWMCSFKASDAKTQCPPLEPCDCR